MTNCYVPQVNENVPPTAAASVFKTCIILFRTEIPWQNNQQIQINNYLIRFSHDRGMIARIIKAEVCVICRSRRPGMRITQTDVLKISLS